MKYVTTSRPAPLLATLAVAFLTGCFPTRNDGKSDIPSSTSVLARIDVLPLTGTGDTAKTTFTYDANGMKVRERFSFITWEWDSLGRYVRWTQHNHRDTNEISTWLTADSSVRASPQGNLKIREKWYGLRPNCRCADSAYRYGFDGSLLHIRRYTYDARGNLLLVTRDYANPARRDTALRYENTYIENVLVSRLSYDAEAEDSTRQFFVYKPLDSVQEKR
jgi:hypothetical protein